MAGCATPPPQPAGPTTDQRLSSATRTLHSEIQDLRDEVKQLRNQLELKSYEIDQMKSRMGASGNTAGQPRVPQRFGQLRGSSDSADANEAVDANTQQTPADSTATTDSRQVPAAQDVAAESGADDGSTMPGAGEPESAAAADENQPEPAPNDGAMAPAASQPGASGGSADMAPEATPDDAGIAHRETSDAGSGAPAQGATAVSENEQATYDQAFGLLKQSRFDEAHSALQQFVSNYPASPLADNAQYWSGEALYAMRAFDRAVTEFDKVVQNYPDSDKAPEALLKKGYSYYELGDLAAAEATLNQVVSQYPGSRVSVAAKNRLTQISSDKRKQGAGQ